MNTRTAALLLAALLCCSSAALAQESRASISGTVTDSSGSLVPGAMLKVTNVETSVSFTATSNAAGQYRFLFLNPGTYRLSAEMSGFKNFVRDGIVLHVNQTATVDVALEVGALAETVTVTSEAPLLDTEKVDRGVVIDNQRVSELPLNIRNPIMLAAISAGIIHTSGTQHLNPFSNDGISSWSVNGGRASNNEFLLDGAPNNAIYNQGNRIAYVPPVDAVEEFKVMTGIYDAQYGRTGGGVINVSMKSGTNTFHGSAYEFLKRTQLNANTFSNNAKKQPRQGNALNQYGFSLGGPVLLPKLYRGRDRTFFFFSWEGYGEDTYYPSESISSVPTLEQRRGDFSNTKDQAGRPFTIYDPMTGRQEGNAWVRDPFPGNKIPSGRINTFGAKVANAYPEPNTVTPGALAWQSNFILSPNVGRFDFNNYVSRIDHQFGPRERVYGRWSYNNFKQLRNTNGIPGMFADWRYGGKVNNGLVLDSVTSLSSRTILNVRGALTRWYEKLGPYQMEGFDATQLGWPRELVAQLPKPWMVPRVDVDGARSLGPTQFTYEPTTVISIQPNVAMIRGRQTLKGGLDYRRTGYTRVRPENGGGLLGFSRGFTRRDYLTQDAFSGFGTASLLLGYPGSGSISNEVEPYFGWTYYSPWFQDDIKLTRRFTLNLGLRWDVNMPVTERFNRLNRDFFAATLNPISQRIDQAKFPGYTVYGGIGFAGMNGLSRSPYDPDYNNVQPRLGAACQLTSKIVVRGGWGIFYLNPTSNGGSSGFSQSTPYVSSLDSGRTPANIATDPFPSGVLRPAGATKGMETFLGQGISYSHTQAKISYVHQFSFGFQVQLPGRMRLDAAYVGSRTRDAFVSKSLNEPSLEILALGDSTKGGNPNYLTQQIPNPFAGLIPGTALNNATASRFQLARPFPQFSGVSQFNRNEGSIWYNSMQLVLEKRASHGLTFTTTYTLSKNIEALGYLNAQDARLTPSLVSWDRPHRLAIVPIYELPFGPGRKFLGGSRGFVGRVAGGWQVVFSGVIQSGAPMSIPGGVWLLGDPHLENPTWDRLFKTGVIDLDGKMRNVQPGEQPVFQIRPPYTLRTTPDRWGNLRNRWANTYDIALTKATRIREGMRVQFRAEAFNAFNTPVFSGNPNLDPNSPNFGRIFRDNGQSNSPRNVQLGVRMTF